MSVSVSKKSEKCPGESDRLYDRDPELSVVTPGPGPAQVKALLAAAGLGDRPPH